VSSEPQTFKFKAVAVINNCS